MYVPRDTFVHALAATASLQLSWPNPEPCTGNCTWVHDPSLIRRSDGTWFRFSTNDNIRIATAKNITGPWKYTGSMLPKGSKIHVTDAQQIWAPDVSLIGDTYHGYYAVSTVGSQNSDIGVATSKSAEPGSWTDHGSVGIRTSKSYNLIDPNLFRECPTCQPYFNFGSSWGDIYQTTLNNDLLSASSAIPSQRIYNSTAPRGGTNPVVVEGSFMFGLPVNNKKYYYMFFSSGACCKAKNELDAPGDEYKIMVCRAESPTGPFKDKSGKDCLKENGGSLVLGSHGNVYAPGGQGVIEDPDSGKVALYYHYGKHEISRNVKKDIANH